MMQMGGQHFAGCWYAENQMAVQAYGVRKYGDPPYRLAVIHGGPGAPGYMAPVARELSKHWGVLEPLQSAHSFQEQIRELESQLLSCTGDSLILVGSSWGAVLTLSVAARQRVPLQKLILIGSVVFDRQHSDRVRVNRLKRLNPTERQRFKTIEKRLRRSRSKTAKLLQEWLYLRGKTDFYDPISRDLEILEVQFETFQQVWSDFVRMRDQKGALKARFSRVEVPVVVLHGEYDPHPIEGIRPLLKGCLPKVAFHILPHCGHYPWLERKARDSFFQILVRIMHKLS